MKRIAVIIPALNEEESIGCVLSDIPKDLNADVIVVDNGSTDRTAETAESMGARVVSEPRRGYGAACLAGLQSAHNADILVFLDADYSDRPAEMERLIEPITARRADLVIGSRMLGKRERGALPPHSVFGNWLAGKMLSYLYGERSTDLGPFRAIRAQSLEILKMQDRAYGWTMEMQAKAARSGLRVVEVPVSYHRRIGRSKITGSLIASIKAAWAILLKALVTLAWRPGQLEEKSTGR